MTFLSCDTQCSHVIFISKFRFSPCCHEHLNHVCVSPPGRLMQCSEATGVFVVDSTRTFIDELLHSRHVPCCCCTVQLPEL